MTAKDIVDDSECTGYNLFIKRIKNISTFQSYLHFDPLQGFYFQLPVEPQDRVDLGGFLVVVFSIQVGIATAIVPPPPMASSRAVGAPIVIVFVISGKRKIVVIRQ